MEFELCSRSGSTVLFWVFFGFTLKHKFDNQSQCQSLLVDLLISSPACSLGPELYPEKNQNNL